MACKVGLCFGVVLALVPRGSHAGRCGSGCEWDDRGDRCWSFRDCDDDYSNDQRCCCEGENSCHRGHEPSRPWNGVQKLTLTSKTGLGCDADDRCESDCYQSFSVDVSDVWFMTLSPLAVTNCSCPTGNVPQVTTDYNAYGNFDYGHGSFTATLSHDRQTASITRMGPSGICTFNYGVEQNDFTAEAAAAVGFILVIACLSFAIPMGGIMFCISNKRQSGGEPQPMAWLACVLIFCVAGPCFMWIPFVIDSCYRKDGPTFAPQPQQQMPVAMAVAAPVQQQPIVAQATALPAGAMPVATATATVQQSQQPPVATVTAVQPTNP